MGKYFNPWKAEFETYLYENPYPVFVPLMSTLDYYKTFNKENPMNESFPILDRVELLLGYAPIVNFVNAVRESMGLDNLTTLPRPTGRYDASTCPIAKALPGIPEGEGDIARVSYSGAFHTSSYTLAKAVAKAAGVTSFQVTPGATARFVVKLPSLFSSWIGAIDHACAS